MISVVCVYNNKRILQDYLLKSLKHQTAKFQLILIDNTNGKFKSAAEALNYGGKQARGRYIMFVHQDVDLSSSLWLEKVEKMLNKLPNLGVAGVAGKSENRRYIITNIKQGNPPKLAGKIQIKKPTKVQTLDECLIIVPRSVFNKIKFDEETCDNWHLYAVEYCLTVRRYKYNIYVLPIYVYHRSPGYSMSKEYYSTLKKVLKKYGGRYKTIYTTMGDWNASYPLKIQRVYKNIKRFIITLLEILRIKNEIKNLLKYQ